MPCSSSSRYGPEDGEQLVAAMGAHTGLRRGGRASSTPSGNTPPTSSSRTRVSAEQIDAEALMGMNRLACDAELDTMLSGTLITSGIISE